jgi:hypothetical protein
MSQRNFVPAQKPGQTICFTGQVPIDATIYELEKLQCNLCGEVFSAQAPGNKTGRDYDASAMARTLSFKHTCSIRSLNSFPILVDLMNSYFKKREPDLSWL